MRWIERFLIGHLRRHLLRIGRAGGAASGPGREPPPLRFFLFGFSGVRNAGADARMEEAVRQVLHLFGRENTEVVSLLSTRKPGGMFTRSGAEMTRGYFAGARCETADCRMDRYILKTACNHHVSMVVEGAVFKSNLSNVLTLAFAGLLGAADRAGNLSLAWGVEAGRMDPEIAAMVQWACPKSHLIVRNPSSVDALRKLGLNPVLGTDCAWTFHPRPPSYGEDRLRKAGWDGNTPVLAVCPINPYWVPSTSSPGKWLVNALTGRYRYAHRGGMTFHMTGAEVEAKHRRYLDAIAGAVRAHREAYPCFPVLVGTSLIDDRSCRMLSERLGAAPVFSAEEYDMFETVSLLRCASRIVTSRFHAGVLAMPQGVPFAAVTLDERLRNLLAGFGREDLAIDCGDADLEEKLKRCLGSLVTDADALRAAQWEHVREQLRGMGQMGRYLARIVKERWPSFPMPARGDGWEEYLPLTDPVLQKLLENK